MTDPVDTPPATPPAKPPAARWRGRVMAAMVAVGAAALVYVFFSAATNTQGGGGISRFAQGGLASLEAMPDAPEQPSATFAGPDGTPTSLAAFRGKVIVVNLWATWCAPCVTEMPTLAALQAKFRNAPFEVVAISVDRPDAGAEAKAKLAELSGGGLRFFHDPQMAVVYPMKARGFPTTIVYDAQGKEIARLAGEADWNSPEAHGLIEAALSGAV